MSHRGLRQELTGSSLQGLTCKGVREELGGVEGEAVTQFSRASADPTGAPGLDGQPGSL